jgi:DNA repair exonuclease SbcCD ATPase subunit
MKELVTAKWAQREIDKKDKKIAELEARIAELEAIEKSHRKLNGELQTRITELEETKATYSQSTIKLIERINELEALIPTKEEVGLIINYICASSICSWCFCRSTCQYKSLVAKLQKIAGNE